MTEEELCQEAEVLLKEFSSLPLVKKYQQLKQAVNSDSHLQEIKTRRDTLKASLRYLPNEKKQEAINAVKTLTEEYDSDPLVINFRSYEEEVYKLIEPLTEAKL